MNHRKASLLMWLAFLMLGVVAGAQAQQTGPAFQDLLVAKHGFTKTEVKEKPYGTATFYKKEVGKLKCFFAVAIKDGTLIRVSLSAEKGFPKETLSALIAAGWESLCQSRGSPLCQQKEVAEKTVKSLWEQIQARWETGKDAAFEVEPDVRVMTNVSDMFQVVGMGIR
jgi:hypothetical protein